ncbi:hypothetical protein VCRA2119O240_510012 [Vibrio crassostreae]|nr:hypothetical protein VCRA2118O236_490003 [Vibrio crassostreae]CAK2117858.1 hypothetical protein VCRA2110O177_420016 [Vibrio crassostreae]CAK2119685.1 hypothetical protein VCRA2110O180_440016 [Vibrio crassostreae]CAK2120134.1 hypothetical protein VCRA2110O181_420004 [Vibrio crassostreae]CAK2122634.1 hypothetical protein VCRA2113O198_450003 [Vibrio crassostreae]
MLSLIANAYDSHTTLSNAYLSLMVSDNPQLSYGDDPPP